MNIRYVKHTLFALIISTLVFSSAANAQRNAASVDVLNWLTGNFKLQYERSLSDKLSFNVPFYFGIKKAVFSNTSDGTQFGLNLGLKYYVTGKATDNGFYVNPLLGFSFYMPTAPSGTSSDTYAFLNYGFNFGYAVNFRGFWIDTYAGVSNIASPLSDKSQQLSKLVAANWNAGVMFGYNW